MRGVDIVNQFSEDIYKKLKKAEVHPLVMEVIMQQHEEIRMLQNAVNDLLKDQVKMVEALQLSQQIMQNYKQQIAKFERRYSDPNMEILNSMNSTDD